MTRTVVNSFSHKNLHKFSLLFWVIRHLVDRSVPFLIEQALSFPVENIEVMEHVVRTEARFYNVQIEHNDRKSLG